MLPRPAIPPLRTAGRRTAPTRAKQLKRNGSRVMNDLAGKHQTWPAPPVLSGRSLRRGEIPGALIASCRSGQREPSRGSRNSALRSRANWARRRASALVISRERSLVEIPHQCLRRIVFHRPQGTDDALGPSLDRCTGDAQGPIVAFGSLASGGSGVRWAPAGISRS